MKASSPHTSTPPLPLRTIPRPAPAGRRRRAVAAVCIGVGLVTLAVLWMALGSSGATAPREVLDPGALVRWGLPLATTVHHLAMGITWAGLVFATTVVPRSTPVTGAGQRGQPGASVTRSRCRPAATASRDQLPASRP